MTDVESASNVEGGSRSWEPNREATRLGRHSIQLSSDSPNSPKILTVRWGVTINLGNYQSARLDAECWVDGDTGPEEALRQLQSWVAAHGPVTDAEMDTLQRSRETYSYDLRRLDDSKRELQRRLKAMHEFCDANNLTWPERLSEDLPF
jgi:hypothetical protein